MPAREDAILTSRDLNRTLLARQHLLGRADLAPADALRHLVGMQSQQPNDPYLALWNRIDGFQTDHLADLMGTRQVVRASLMRGTIHLVTADDYPWLASALLVMHRSGFKTIQAGKRLDLDRLDEFVGAGEAALTGTPMTLKALATVLAGQFPDDDATAIAQAIRFHLPLIQTTPRGVWGRSQAPTWALTRDWLGIDIEPKLDAERLITRYLAAFGPATIADVQAWSGLTGLTPLAKRMGDRLVIRHDETGRTLFDLPDAPIVAGDTAAPVRFLPVFDNLLLSHKDRTRIISESRRKRIQTNNGLFAATILIGGYVGATWRLDGEVLTIRPFTSLAHEMTEEIEAEGCAMIRFWAGFEPRFAWNDDWLEQDERV